MRSLNKRNSTAGTVPRCQTTTEANRISWPTMKLEIAAGTTYRIKVHLIYQTRISFTFQKINCGYSLQTEPNRLCFYSNRISARHISVQLYRVHNPSTFFRSLSNILGFLVLEWGVVGWSKHEIRHIWIKVDQLDDTCFIIYCSTCFRN